MPFTVRVSLNENQKVTNKRVAELADINNMSCEMRRRRWNETDYETAVDWRPEGRKVRGRPR